MRRCGGDRGGVGGPSRRFRALGARRRWREQRVAHRRGPGLAVELDQRLEFAQMMGVAQGVLDLPERAIGHEAVMHDDAALQIQGDRAALFLGAVEGERLAGGRAPPVELARDPDAGSSTADLRPANAPDPRIHPLRSSADLRTQAVKLVGHRRGAPTGRPAPAPRDREGAVDVEIDRRRLIRRHIAPARSRRRGTAPGHAPAARAT